MYKCLFLVLKRRNRIAHSGFNILCSPNSKENLPGHIRPPVSFLLLERLHATDNEKTEWIFENGVRENGNSSLSFSNPFFVKALFLYNRVSDLNYTFSLQYHINHERITRKVCLLSYTIFLNLGSFYSCN